MVEVISKNWLAYFLKELKDSKQVFLISPFINNVLVDHLLKNSSEAKIRFITRFNLNDFRARVSSLSALKRLVEVHAEIKGIQGLHSKVYTFDSKSTIIGSANFTSGGFFSNYELGVLSKELDTITKSIAYFNRLWNLDSEILSLSKIHKWEEELKKASPSIPPESLNDYGKKATQTGSYTKNYFIKLFGKDDNREVLDYTSREELERSHCHWALTFSGKKGRPIRYQDGDVVYMARMLYGRDYAIFGKGVALRHIAERDVASDDDIDEIDWKVDWPVYIRIYDAEFIDGTMADCPKMSELINEALYDSFDKTHRKQLDGKEDINAWNSLKRQADVQLSAIGAEWVESKFQEAKTIHGRIPDNFISNLYPGNPTLVEIMQELNLNTHQ